MANARGPNDQKIKLRSKIPLSIETFNLARKFQSRRLDFPTKNTAAVGGSLEILNLARNFQSRSKSRIFLIVGGPLLGFEGPQRTTKRLVVYPTLSFFSLVFLGFLGVFLAGVSLVFRVFSALVDVSDIFIFFCSGRGKGESEARGEAGEVVFYLK